MKFLQAITLIFSFLPLSSAFSAATEEKASWVQTPYEEPKVLFEFYFDDPQKTATALYWLRSFINPLLDSPYDMAPEFMDLIVLIHGTEIVTVAKKNYQKYTSIVERMRYYHALGVKFKVCNIASQDYGYTLDDYYNFIEVIPSAMVELAHWQQQGYALIRPEVMEKKLSIEEIR
jgi:uncharacterized protein